MATAAPSAKPTSGHCHPIVDTIFTRTLRRALSLSFLSKGPTLVGYGAARLNYIETPALIEALRRVADAALVATTDCCLSDAKTPAK